MPLQPRLKPRWRPSPAALPRVLALGALIGVLVTALAAPMPSGVRPVHAQTTTGDPLLWTIGGPGADEARQVAVDGAGNVYVTGVFTASVDADPGPASMTLTSAGDTDIFLAKYGPDGSLVWAWSIGGPNADQANGVAVDRLGNVYLAGGFGGVVDFAPGEADASVDTGAERSGFVAKYDQTGALIWVTPLALAGDDEVLSMALDGAGNVVAAGLARMSTSPGQPSTIQRGDLLALRLDADGRLVWSAVLPTASQGMGPVAVAVTPAGEICLATSYTGTVRVALGTGLIDATSAGGSDILVMKLASGGGLVWARTMGGPGNDAPGTGGLAVDPSGNIALTGSFDGKLDVAGDKAWVLSSEGQTHMLLVSLDPGGAVRWATKIGGGGEGSGTRVTIDAAQYVYVTGWFAGRPDESSALDGYGLIGRGEQGAKNGFVAKYTPDGQLAWARALGGRGIGPGQSSIATSVAMNLRGDVLVAGRYFGTDALFGMLGGVNAILGSAGQSDAFVAAFGPDGSLRTR